MPGPMLTENVGPRRPQPEVRLTQCPLFPAFDVARDVHVSSHEAKRMARKELQ